MGCLNAQLHPARSPVAAAVRTSKVGRKGKGRVVLDAEAERKGPGKRHRIHRKMTLPLEFVEDRPVQGCKRVHAGAPYQTDESALTGMEHKGNTACG